MTDVITHLPLTALRESPFNPRKHFSERDWWRAALQTMAADDLAALAFGVALDDMLDHRAMLASGCSPRERAAAKVAMAMRHGVDPAAIANPQQEPQPEASTPAPKGVKYRCKETGSTWSGKGQQPAWLKAMLAKGVSLVTLQV